MQPPTPRSYALAVPTGDYPRKTPVPLSIDIHTVHCGSTVDGALELIVIKSGTRRTRAPTREFKSRLLDLTTAPDRQVCAFDLAERRS